MTQFILDCFPDAVSQFGLIGCATFAGWLALFGANVCLGVDVLRRRGTLIR
jgi:hypothetical protein